MTPGVHVLQSQNAVSNLFCNQAGRPHCVVDFRLWLFVFADVEALLKVVVDRWLNLLVT